LEIVLLIANLIVANNPSIKQGKKVILKPKVKQSLSGLN